MISLDMKEKLRKFLNDFEFSMKLNGVEKGSITIKYNIENGLFTKINFPDGPKYVVLDNKVKRLPEAVKRIRCKFKKPVPLEFESVEDEDGFI